MERNEKITTNVFPMCLLRWKLCERKIEENIQENLSRWLWIMMDNDNDSHRVRENLAQIRKHQRLMLQNYLLALWTWELMFLFFSARTLMIAVTNAFLFSYLPIRGIKKSTNKSDSMTNLPISTLNNYSELFPSQTQLPWTLNCC